MSGERPEPRSNLLRNRRRPREPGEADGTAAAGLVAADGPCALIVGRSEITCVVVARIAERVGLHPVSTLPDRASALAATLRPLAIVIDGGADNRDGDPLAPGVEALRRLERGAPVVVFLSNRNGTRTSLGLPEIVDAVVAKPITPERLEPVLRRLLPQLRR